ncbi:MAG TPA: VTT domain-containing protein [Propionibacteriaceae bacterium]|nr:VTT domain-containing protein [Propionibacteriaceae bacterium]
MNPLDWDTHWSVVALGLFVIVMARANGTYWLGRLSLAQGRRTRLARWIDSPSYARAAGWLNRWGAPAVSLSFLTVGVQTLVNLAAGVTKMPLRRYLPAVTVGCILWAMIYATIGLIGWELAGWAWQRSPAGVVVFVVLAASAIGVWVNRRHPATSVGAPTAQLERVTR